MILLLNGLFGFAEYQRSPGINVDLWWGLLMLVFGRVMTGINYFLMRHSARYAVREEPERAPGE